jgi:hypothetical protein
MFCRKHFWRCVITREWRRSLRHHQKVTRSYSQHRMRTKIAVRETSFPVRLSPEDLTYRLRDVQRTVSRSREHIFYLSNLLHLYTIYSVMNAPIHLKIINFTSPPHDMFRPQRAIIRCLNYIPNRGTRIILWNVKIKIKLESEWNWSRQISIECTSSKLNMKHLAWINEHFIYFI